MSEWANSAHDWSIWWGIHKEKMMSPKTKKENHVFFAVSIADCIICEVNCLAFSPYAFIKPNQSAVSCSPVYFRYSKCFIRKCSLFLSFACTLDSGLPCEASEGQCLCNCVWVSLISQMQEERKLHTANICTLMNFFFSLCAWAKYWLSAGGMYELTETANILTGSL